MQARLIRLVDIKLGIRIRMAKLQPIAAFKYNIIFDKKLLVELTNKWMSCPVNHVLVMNELPDTQMAYIRVDICVYLEQL